VFKLNEFRVIGTVQTITLNYRQKTDKSTVPVCEIELEVPNGPPPDIMKAVAFYDKAEEIAANIAEGDIVLVKGRLKCTKTSYQGKTAYNTEIWANDVQKEQ